jgi:hypothetical protein
VWRDSMWERSRTAATGHIRDDGSVPWWHQPTRLFATAVIASRATGSVPCISGRRRASYGLRQAPAVGGATKGAAVTYLIVGLDRTTHARWHQNVSASDIGTAEWIAQARARAQGIELIIAAVIGTNSAVMSDPAEERAVEAKAA